MATTVSLCSCFATPAIVGSNLAKHNRADRLTPPQASFKQNLVLETTKDCSSANANDLNYERILSADQCADRAEAGCVSSKDVRLVPLMTLADASVQSDGQQPAQDAAETGEGGGNIRSALSRANLEATWENLVETTEVAMDKVPGPRVGPTPIPWLVAVPVTYAAVSLVIAIVKLYRKANTPRAKRKKQVSKNQTLNDALNAFFPDNRTGFTEAEFLKVQRMTGFTAEEVLRKHIRYTLNERPFNPDLVADLLHLRKVSGLSDEAVAEILNDVSRRVVASMGVVMMNTQGMTERGIKRKAAVQSLFAKILYLSELEEFCASSVRDKLQTKVIFGVTDEDSDLIRIDTLSELSDMDALEMMVSPPSASDVDEKQER
ncbi:hypothetical protein CBR_g39443 [Chara braunii]|uniref:Armadillo-like repeats domain-containing protein n=1 Tax=Chara braunii TaxID=69332 RepID=A0A388LRM1_CHABU|nr:hypothetical protein CBR_g39443 [Chara braunii]|eukprot:GBG84980.1 hypothetical protein CBR_g39443 [Chara braunii]